MDPLLNATKYAADQFTKKKYGTQLQQPGAQTVPGVPQVPGGGGYASMVADPGGLDMGGGGLPIDTDPGGTASPVDPTDDTPPTDDTGGYNVDEVDVETRIPGDSGSYTDPDDEVVPVKDPTFDPVDDPVIDPVDPVADPVDDPGNTGGEVDDTWEEVADPIDEVDPVDTGGTGDEWEDIGPVDTTEPVDGLEDQWGNVEPVDPTEEWGSVDPGDSGGRDPGKGDGDVNWDDVEVVDDDSMLPEDDQPQSSDVWWDEDGNAHEGQDPRDEDGNYPPGWGEEGQDSWTNQDDSAYRQQYLDNAFGKWGDFDPTQQLMEEQRDSAARQFAEAMAGRGMSQSGFAAGGMADIYRSSTRDTAAQYQDFRQQNIQNQQQAASMLFQDNWKRMDQDQQKAMAELMHNLDQQKRHGAEGEMGEYDMQILRDLLNSDNLDAEGKMLLNNMMRDWMGDEGYDTTFSDENREEVEWEEGWAGMADYYRTHHGWTDEQIQEEYEKQRAEWEAQRGG